MNGPFSIYLARNLFCPAVNRGPALLLREPSKDKLAVHAKTDYSDRKKKHDAPTLPKNTDTNDYKNEQKLNETPAAGPLW